jgi:CTP-dependent riboflavin kinase
MPVLRGSVTTGIGNFSIWIERLRDHYFQKTGMYFYPGTLNIALEHEYTIPPQRTRLEAEEYGGRVSVNIVPCRVFGRHAFLLRTDANERGEGHHARNIIEIACDVCLRDTYGLSDGSIVEVEI